MQRLIFANQLRGIAALSVVVSHLVGVFWSMRDFIGVATASPVLTEPPPDVFVLVSYPWFNFGPFGVGLFFLISGLVIPFSVDRHSRTSFVLARGLRIYPTYIVAIGIGVAVLHANSAYWQLPFPYGRWAILSNLTLLHTLSGQPSIDLVNWTLGVEMKFYLVMALAAPLVRRASVATLFVIAAVLAGMVLAIGQLPLGTMPVRPQAILQQLSTELVFLIFMLAGVLFNYHVRGKLRSLPFVAALVGMMALFLGCWRISLNSGQFPVVTVSYLCAFLAFGSAYLLRRHARPLRLLDFFAAISFPLYLVHSLIGFSIIKLLMITGNLSYGSAVAMALASVIALATMLHATIEQASIRLGRRLAPEPPRSARRLPAARHGGDWTSRKSPR